MSEEILKAVSVLRGGGVIAYPTEYCFGLGCDPQDSQAVEKIVKIKRRAIKQGVLLIAADINQVREYADLAISPLEAQILASWPGPITWTLPKQQSVPVWITGEHQSIAMRMTSHAISIELCRQFGQAIVSTSANRHGQSPLMTAQEVEKEMVAEVDFVVHAKVGGATHASTIRDGMTGITLR